jgi:hypothetical protein
LSQCNSGWFCNRNPHVPCRGRGPRYAADMAKRSASTLGESSSPTRPAQPTTALCDQPRRLLIALSSRPGPRIHAAGLPRARKTEPRPPRPHPHSRHAETGRPPPCWCYPACTPPRNQSPGACYSSDVRESLRAAGRGGT